MKTKNLSPQIYAALYLGRKTASEKAYFGYGILASMTGNLQLTTPNPPLSVYETCITALSNAITAANEGGPLEKANLLQAEENFDNLTICLKDYVQNVANLNTPADARVIITSAGMSIRKSPEKTAVPEPVATIAASYTGVSGSILLAWADKKLGNAYTYEAFVTTTPTMESSWMFAGSTSKKQLMIANLSLPATRYYFRLVKVGTAGSSAPSAVCSSTTPAL